VNLTLSVVEIRSNAIAGCKIIVVAQNLTGISVLIVRGVFKFQMTGSEFEKQLEPEKP